MSFAYNELYLYDAMRNLGEMTEYANDACSIGPDRAISYFLVSGYADRFEKGDPSVVSGMSGTELFLASAEKCGLFYDLLPPLTRYETGEYYWIGYILALFQWRINRSFSSILSVIQASDLISMYPALHTASEEKAIEVIMRLFRKKSGVSRLQEYRKKIKMTQSELARASGVNLRTLQQYESGAKSLNKAAAESVFSLSSVLRCDPSELIISCQ